MAGNAARNPPRYFEGQTFVGPNAAELGAWNQRLGYTNQVFGGGGGGAPRPQLYDQAAFTGDMNQLAGGGGEVKPQPPAGGSPQNPFAGPRFADLIGATNRLMGGGAASQMLGTLSPVAMGGLSSSFANGPDQISVRGFDANLDPSRFNPTFGTAGGLDARDAYGRMLTGTPDYAGAQGAIDAANAPLLRQFQQDVLPSIAGRAGISGHDTGAIKTLNRVLPDLGERMSNNALSIMEGERQRALGAQERAAGAVSQGGLQGYGLGLQGAGQQLGANQALAQFGFNQDLSNAGLSGDFRNQALGFGNLTGALAGQQSQDVLRGASLWPQLYGLGQEPANQLAGLGSFNRQFDEAGLNDAMSRWDFQQNQPMRTAEWYSQIANGMGGLGGSASQQMPVNRIGGAFGGALAGSQIGANVGQGYPGWGALLGGLLGAYGG